MSTHVRSVHGAARSHTGQPHRGLPALGTRRYGVRDQYELLSRIERYCRHAFGSKAGDRIPGPLDGRHGFDTGPIRRHPPGIVRGARY